MTKEAESTEEPAAPAPERKSPPVHWIWMALITGAALTAAANYLIYSRGPGAGWAVFFLLLALGIFLNRRNAEQPIIRGLEIGLGTLLAVSAIQMMYRPSFSNAVVLFILTLITSTHFLQERASDTPTARKLVEALRNLFLSPFRWIQASALVAKDGIFHAPEIAASAPSPRTIGRVFQIVVPAVVLIIPFALLLSQGNSILGQFVSNAFTSLLDSLSEIAPPSPLRIFFIGFIATITLGLLWRTSPSKVLDTVLTKLGSTAKTPGDHFVARWRTILILLGVNVLFFIANSIDIAYIWREIELPEGMTVSEFVHEGTNSLIASAIIAAIVLGLLFQQHESVTRARAIRGLAILWITQNVLLLFNVARRVAIYVEEYDLSVLRLHLVLFLVLVSVGFVLLAIRIQWNRSFGWLISANVAAVFILFASIQFWDTRKTVAEYNFARATETDSDKTLDTYYLSKLGPSAWPTLAKAAESQTLSPTERADASKSLAAIREEETQDAEEEDWRDFRWERNHLRKSLLAHAGAN